MYISSCELLGVRYQVSGFSVLGLRYKGVRCMCRRWVNVIYFLRRSYRHIRHVMSPISNLKFEISNLMPHTLIPSSHCDLMLSSFVTYGINATSSSLIVKPTEFVNSGRNVASVQAIMPINPSISPNLIAQFFSFNNPKATMPFKANASIIHMPASENGFSV
jgi:hypothetical protein